MSSAQFSRSSPEPAPRRGSALFTIGMIAVLGAIHFYVSRLSPAEQNSIYVHFALIPERLVALGDHSLEAFATFLTYAMLHGDWRHFAFNAYALIAFGLIVERILGFGRTAILYTASALGGGLLYFVLHMDGEGLVVGASGAISGLFGAAVPLAPPHMRRAMYTNAAVWMGLNVFLPWLQQQAGGNIAWDAHLGGFVVGLGMGWLMRPAGIAQPRWPRGGGDSGRGSQTGDRNNPGKTTIAQPVQPKKKDGPVIRR